MDATPKPSISTKLRGSPFTAAVAPLLKVTVVPLMAVTRAEPCIFVPYTLSPTAILVASATTSDVPPLVVVPDV